MAFIPALPEPAAGPPAALSGARAGGGEAVAGFATMLAALRNEAGPTNGTSAPGPGKVQAPEAARAALPALLASGAPRAVRATILESAAGLVADGGTALPTSTSTPTAAPTGEIAVVPDDPAGRPDESMAATQESADKVKPERVADEAASPTPVSVELATAPEEPDQAMILAQTPILDTLSGDDTTEVDLPEIAPVGPGRAAAEAGPVEDAGEIALAVANAGTLPAPAATAPAPTDQAVDSSEPGKASDDPLVLAGVRQADDVVPRPAPRAPSPTGDPTIGTARPASANPATQGPELPVTSADTVREAVAGAAAAADAGKRQLPANGTGSDSLPVSATSGAHAVRADAVPASPPPARGEAPAPQARNAGEVSLILARAAADGQRQITIRLHPAELGKVEVRLDFGHDGALKAAIRADTPEALDLLQRDVRLLERALNDAGFRQGQTNLDFSLGQEARQQAQGHAPAGAGRPDNPEAGEQAILDAAMIAGLAERRTSAGGIDIVI